MKIADFLGTPKHFDGRFIKNGRKENGFSLDICRKEEGTDIQD